MIFLSIFTKDNNKVDANRHTLSVNEWPEHVVTLDKKNFDDFINKYPLSIVDFWAPWCSPCKTMTPRLRRLSKVYKGNVAFGRLDTQENQNLAKKYKIMGIPNLVFFSYGKKISSITGLKSVGVIKSMIDDLLKKL
jgi:thioredoxin 1